MRFLYNEKLDAYVEKRGTCFEIINKRGRCIGCWAYNDLIGGERHAAVVEEFWADSNKDGDERTLYFFVGILERMYHVPHTCMYWRNQESWEARLEEVMS